jgi:hypothetical protein
MNPKKVPISGFVIATIVILIVFFAVLTYISWGTDIGVSLRYFYYLTAIFTLSLVVTVIGIALSENQRRNQEERDRFLHRLRMIENYWIDLEKIFMQYNPELNRLYKEMWPTLREIQTIPDPPITPRVEMQESHTAHLIIGMIYNVNASVLYGKKDHSVLDIWHQPEYRNLINMLGSFMKSNIIYRRWLSTKQYHQPDMEILVNELRDLPI